MSLTTTSRPPRWAEVAAHVIPVLVLPSSLWRVLLVFGLSAGITDHGLAGLNPDGWGGVYLLSLSIVSEGVALMSFGLVRGWGEVFPRWIPLVGGTVVPIRFAVTVASVGAVILAVLWTPLLTWWTLPHPDMTDTGSLVIGLLYLPMVFWPPLLAALTVSYRRRRLVDAASGNPRMD